MVRPRIGIMVLAVVAAVGWLSVGEVTADTILPDPIVRVGTGGNSIPIAALPFTFDFGAFPAVPDPVPWGGSPGDCYSFTDTSTGSNLNGVGCNFQNRTGVPITYLNFLFSGQGPQPITAYTSPFFAVATGGTGFTASFGGGTGIPTATLVGQVWSGGEFFVEVAGFVPNTVSTMSTVPEPASLSLLAAGLAAAAIRRRRR
jgi:hypothetical protein